MKVIVSESQGKGGLSVLLFHCLFNKDDSITHFLREFDQNLYQTLPHLYAVCIAQNASGSKVLTGGFVIKTSYTHDDPGFLTTLENAVQIEPALKALVPENSSFLPARLGLTGSTPPTESEMVGIMAKQHIKFSD